MWAIPRQLGRRDSTKLDEFWEASPEAMRRTN
jgi:hypothetical protein